MQKLDLWQSTDWQSFVKLRVFAERNPLKNYDYIFPLHFLHLHVNNLFCLFAFYVKKTVVFCSKVVSAH